MSANDGGFNRSNSLQELYEIDRPYDARISHYRFTLGARSVTESQVPPRK